MLRIKIFNSIFNYAELWILIAHISLNLAFKMKYVFWNKICANPSLTEILMVSIFGISIASVLFDELSIRVQFGINKSYAQSTDNSMGGTSFKYNIFFFFLKFKSFYTYLTRIRFHLVLTLEFEIVWNILHYFYCYMQGICKTYCDHYVYVLSFFHVLHILQGSILHFTI